MRFDHFADIAHQQVCPTGQPATVAGLVSGVVDGCTAWSCRPRSPQGGGQGKKKPPAPAEEARGCYMQQASSATDLGLPVELHLEAGFDDLPDSSWVGIEVAFVLETPWYSKDDRPFHVLDNPVRKDRVFGVPFMSASSWKGLLRWSCRMQAGLLGYLEGHRGKLDGWTDPPWIPHLFGNEKGEKERFHRGALAFYPTWFSRLGFEVINPHSRERRAGTQPIYYEVVPAGTVGMLRLLYAPLPGDRAHRADALRNLVDAIDSLLTTYGISAKRTAGWGAAKAQVWSASRKGGQPIEGASIPDFKKKLEAWTRSPGGVA